MWSATNKKKYKKREIHRDSQTSSEALQHFVVCSQVDDFGSASSLHILLLFGNEISQTYSYYCCPYCCCLHKKRSTHDLLPHISWGVNKLVFPFFPQSPNLKSPDTLINFSTKCDTASFYTLIYLISWGVKLVYFFSQRSQKSEILKNPDTIWEQVSYHHRHLLRQPCAARYWLSASYVYSMYVFKDPLVSRTCSVDNQQNNNAVVPSLLQWTFDTHPSSDQRWM